MYYGRALQQYEVLKKLCGFTKYDFGFTVCVIEKVFYTINKS